MTRATLFFPAELATFFVVRLRLMAEYGYDFSARPSFSRLQQQASASIDVTDSFIPSVTEELSLYGKRMHLTLYYEQKKHSYIYYLLWWTTGLIGGHLFYVNRVKDGYRRLLMPLYIFLVGIPGIILSALIGKASEGLGNFLLVLVGIIQIVLIIFWIASWIIDLFGSVENVRRANIDIAKGLAARVASVDEKKPPKAQSLK